MATQRLNLTRDQLASFLQDHEQIKQFERLFSVASDVEPASDTQGISISADTALAQAEQALAQIDQLSDVVNTADAAIEARVAQLAAELSELTSSLQILQNTPIDQLTAQLASLSAMVESLPPIVPHKRTRYGQFLDTTTQTAAAINTAQAITLDTTDLSAGVYLGTPTSRIYIDTEAIYDFQFSIQVDKTAGGTGLFYIWPRVNGTDVPNSCSQIQIQGNNAEIFSAANFFLDLKAGDYVEFMFAVNDTTVVLASFPASAFAPAIPSIIVTVSNNIRGQS